MHSAEDAIVLAANVGGDSDSVASIAGGILAAMHPTSVNEHWHRTVEEVKRYQLAPMAIELSRLRQNA